FAITSIILCCTTTTPTPPKKHPHNSLSQPLTHSIEFLRNRRCYEVVCQSVAGLPSSGALLLDSLLDEVMLLPLLIFANYLNPVTNSVDLRFEGQRTSPSLN